MWKNTREDDSRCLKNNAVPTLFYFTKEIKKQKSPKSRQMIKPNESLDGNLMEVNSVGPLNPSVINLNNVQAMPDNIIHNISNNDDLYKSMVFKMNHYKKQLRLVSDKLKKNETNKSVKLLNSVFNNNQKMRCQEDLLNL